jgi:hypothetical protein
MTRRHQLSMESYDRFVPSQDTMPRGGFGSLIALPLQHEARQQSNSVFLDEQLTPYPDEEQWAYLASVPRIEARTVELIAREATRMGSVVGVRLAEMDAEDASPWTRSPSRRVRNVVTSHSTCSHFSLPLVSHRPPAAAEGYPDHVSICAPTPPARVRS